MKKSTFKLRPLLFATALAITASILVSCSDDEEIVPSPALYVTIPDIDFETLLVEQGIDSDGLVNQQMLKSDAEHVTHLNLNLDTDFGEIKDLTGIEAFVSLTRLTAARQQINSLDLSNNTLLDTLYLQANYLESIDLSNNHELLVVDLTLNELTTISGLSANPKLKSLNLSMNFFTSFQLQNESVEHLSMTHGFLNNVDLTEAPNLRGALLTSNQLPALDITNNTLLETLVVSDNNLETIDLSASDNLEYLYISSNALKTLDVSSNRSLIDLRADRNPELACVKIDDNHEIPTVKLSDHQSTSSSCE